MQPPIQYAIEKQIYDPLFPRRDEERPSLAVEVVLEPDRWTKMKPLCAQLLVDAS